MDHRWKRVRLLENRESYELGKARRKVAKLKRVTKGKSRNRTKIDPRELDDADELDLDVEDPRARAPKDLARAALESGEGAVIEAMVVGVFARGCEAFAEGELLECHLAPAIRLDDENDLAPGDHVRVRREPSRNVVIEILPRSSLLSRSDPFDPRKERVIAANIDLVVHVASVVAPPLRPGLIDRYLVAIQHGDAAPLIAVNKVDLLPPEDRDEELSRLDIYRALGVPVVFCSTETREGLDDLRQRLVGKTTVFAGHSGVGKSSLVKALKPELTLRVASVRAKTRTGRHTTTRSTLYDLGNGTRVIDTPGIREFGLWQVDPRELRFYFPEFQEPARSCRFNDCVHDEEPDCGVKAAVEEGRIDADRYANYIKLLEELRAEARV
ncbi:MAG: ribosome small subunit-dependent GTPase A [Thermoanaerobaculia bacterium]